MPHPPMSKERKQVTPLQCRDTTQALTLLCLIVWLFHGHVYWIYAAFGVLLFGMVLPSAMRLPARLWFGLSHVLGACMSRVLLSSIYGLILLPVALVRRAMGKDSLRLHSFQNGQNGQNGQASAFVCRDHVFEKDDLKNPY